MQADSVNADYVHGVGQDRSLNLSTDRGIFALLRRSVAGQVGPNMLESYEDQDEKLTGFSILG